MAKLAIGHFSQTAQKKPEKVAKPAIRHFSKLPQKKAVKVAKLAIRHFLKLPQKKAVKVAKLAFRHFFPSCPKKGGKAGETGFTAFTAFFSASFEKSLSTKKKPALPLLPAFFCSSLENITLFFSVSLAGRGRSLLTKIHTQTARDCDRTSRIPAAMPRNLRAVSCPK